MTEKQKKLVENYIRLQVKERLNESRYEKYYSKGTPADKAKFEKKIDDICRLGIVKIGYKNLIPILEDMIKKYDNMW